MKLTRLLLVALLFPIATHAKTGAQLREDCAAFGQHPEGNSAIAVNFAQMSDCITYIGAVLDVPLLYEVKGGDYTRSDLQRDAREMAMSGHAVIGPPITGLPAFRRSRAAAPRGLEKDCWRDAKPFGQCLGLARIDLAAARKNLGDYALRADLLSEIRLLQIMLFHQKAKHV